MRGRGGLAAGGPQCVVDRVDRSPGGRVLAGFVVTAGAAVTAGAGAAAGASADAAAGAGAGAATGAGSDEGADEAYSVDVVRTLACGYRPPAALHPAGLELGPRSLEHRQLLVQFVVLIRDGLGRWQHLSPGSLPPAWLGDFGGAELAWRGCARSAVLRYI